MIGRPVQKGANELTLGELRKLLEPGVRESTLASAPSDVRSLALNYHRRWALAVTPLVLAFFAVALAGRCQRRRIMQVEKSERLLLQGDPLVLPPQLARLAIQFERAEAQPRLDQLRHVLSARWGQGESSTAVRPVFGQYQHTATCSPSVGPRFTRRAWCITLLRPTLVGSRC